MTFIITEIPVDAEITIYADDADDSIDVRYFQRDGVLYERYQPADAATLAQEKRERDYQEKYGENQ